MRGAAIGAGRRMSCGRGALGGGRGKGRIVSRRAAQKKGMTVQGEEEVSGRQGGRRVK